MRPIHRVLAALLALAAGAGLQTNSAAARPFYVVNVGTDAYSIVDPNAIENVPGGAIRRTWVVTVQQNITNDKAAPQPGYIRTLTEFDCHKQQSRWRKFASFSRSGTPLIARDNPSPAWTGVYDTHPSRVAFQAVCDGYSGDFVISGDSIARVVIALIGTWDPAESADFPSLGKPAPPTAKPPVKR